jgi:predicted alpha/beta hydrolase family esterase
VVSRDLVVVPHSLDVISVINDHVLDRIKVDGQGVLVVESVYTSRPGEWKPELGDYLVDLPNEVPDNRII